MSYPTPGGLSAISRNFTTIYVRVTAVASFVRALSNRSPYNVNPGSKLGPPPITGGSFTIGTDESTCGVTGHAVIVHKGCPSDRDDPCDPGVRIGCCVLA